MFKSRFWKFYRWSWRGVPDQRSPGYTLLMMLPADLPVFTRIAMRTCAAQDPANLVETLVIPDMPSAQFERDLADAAVQWPGGAIRLVNLRPLERWITRRGCSPHTTHWLQLVNGLESCRSTHALLHDADLFITRRDFLAAHYTACADGDFACLGINRVWDNWYAAHGLNHVTATWELMLDVEWARSFAPWELRGHQARFRDELHTFDTLLLPQCLTPPARIARHGGDLGFVHFNYVVCSYRWYQQSPKPYCDEHFRILLIRLLADAFGCGPDEEQVPGLGELEKALVLPGRRISYAGANPRANYGEFRDKLQALVDSGALEAEQNRVLLKGVRKFDEEFGWAPATATPVDAPGQVPT